MYRKVICKYKMSKAWIGVNMHTCIRYDVPVFCWFLAVYDDVFPFPIFQLWYYAHQRIPCSKWWRISVSYISVVVLCASADSVRDIMIKAHELKFDNGEYVFLNIDLFSRYLFSILLCCLESVSSLSRRLIDKIWDDPEYWVGSLY